MFQFEEAPAFMALFYLTLYLVQIILYTVRVYVFYHGTKQFIACLWRTKDYEGGLKALLTPWGAEKSPECRQVTVFAYSCVFLFAWISNGYVMTSHITALVEPGFGLLNSVGTGKLYFGSTWNHFPLIGYAICNYLYHDES